MFRNWSIRQLLLLWAIVTVLATGLIATVAIYSNVLFSSTQSNLTQQILPMEDASRQLTGVAAAFITRQKQIIASTSLAQLQHITPRDQLEQQFDSLLLKLSATVMAIPGGTKLVDALKADYQQFLQIDTQLLKLIEKRHRYNQQMTMLSEDIQQLEQNAQDQAEKLSHTIQQRVTSDKHAAIQLLQQPDVEDLPGKIAPLLSSQHEKILGLSQTIRISVFRITNLTHGLMQQTHSGHVLESSQKQIEQNEASLNEAIASLKQRLSQDDNSLELLMALEKNINSLITDVTGKSLSVYQLRRVQISNETQLTTEQQQAITTLQAMMTRLDELSDLVNQQSLTNVKHSSRVADSERWMIITLASLIVLSMIGFVLSLSARINRPLAQLRQAMNALSLEKFDTRLIQQPGKNEFTLLATDFNRFASNTEKLIAALADAKQTLQIREQHIRAIINGVPEAILILAEDGTITETNPAAEPVLKTSSEQLIGHNLMQFVADNDDFSQFSDNSRQQQVNRELKGIDFHGNPFSMWLSLSPVRSLDGDLWVCVIADVSGWKQTEIKLKQTTSELNAILENAMVGIAFIRDRKLIRVNHKFETLFACKRTDVEGKSTRWLYPNSESYDLLGDQIYTTLREDNNFEAQMELMRFNGERFWCALSSKAVDSQNPIQGSIWLYEDVTQQRQNEEHLTKLASIDTLTGLPNRAVFNDRLEHAIHKARRSSGRLAVFFLDLDHFKHINDSLGHKAGDLLLCEVASRIRNSVRDGDTVARLGGDEFTVVLEDVRSAQYVGKVAEKILQATSEPYQLDSTEVNVSPSIGISLYPADGRDVDMLIRNADAAMYHAKNNGRNNFQFYSAEMNAEAAQRLAMETSLRRAVEHNEFYLHYQPQINLDTGAISGVEVLLRWHTEAWGDVSPARFVPILEDTGLIGVVGEQVLKQSCETFMMLRDRLPEDFVIAVNLSGRQFKGGMLSRYIRNLLTQTGMPASNLELEITESILMENTELAVNTLIELSEMGVTLAIDDFGTGYSSLSYLKQFPLNVLKIDRTFVRDVTDDKDDAAIVDAIMAMSNSLELRVVAEGVETEAQLKFLKQHDCHCAQGYYFSRPLDLDNLIAFIEQGSVTV